VIKKTLYFGSAVYLSVKNNQLIIKIPAVEKCESLPESFKQDAITSKPIEDIGVIVLDNRQITLTHSVLEKLLENDVALITCDHRGLPVGLMLPLSGNTTQNERFRAQLEASVPLKKQLWQQTIQSKIRNQAAMLKQVRGETAKNMLVWADSVRSGDLDNLEARAAAYYWKNLYPSLTEFVRGREGMTPNNLLNYGYAILRATVARGLVVSGLLPTLGIHHHNRYNAYCLADDIMEPYRPFVDELVTKIFNENLSGCEEITKEMKACLLTIPTLEVMIGGQRSPLMVAVSQTTSSLYKCFSGEARKINYPEK
jgi:CRISPR-associated protein Cas1